MKDGEKGGKASNKILAALQIEKVREREKEDSPLTKPCAHRILHHPGNLKKKKKKRKKAQHRSERELIALLLYLLGFVANDFHIATSNALDALRKKRGERDRKE